MSYEYPPTAGHELHDKLCHYGFAVGVESGDHLYDPPVPSTIVDLYGPLADVIAAALVLDASGFAVVDVDQPHICSVQHACVHACLVLDGDVERTDIRNAITAEFGPPISSGFDPISSGSATAPPPTDPQLN
jgi:hypothetical protein